jgi:hypothetical protein
MSKDVLKFNTLKDAYNSGGSTQLYLRSILISLVSTVTVTNTYKTRIPYGPAHHYTY